MLRNILILAGTILVGLGATYLMDYSAPLTMAQSDSALDQSKEQSVPTFEFTDTNGAAHSINDFKGKMVVLNFWASWCAPCVKEFPLFLQLAAAYSDDVVFIGLSSDHNKNDMSKFLMRLRKNYPQEMALDNVIIAIDEKSKITAGLFQTYRLPETIIIDEDGIIIDKLIGAEWAFEDLEDLVVNN